MQYSYEPGFLDLDLTFRMSQSTVVRVCVGGGPLHSTPGRSGHSTQ